MRPPSVNDLCLSIKMTTHSEFYCSQIINQGTELSSQSAAVVKFDVLVAKEFANEPVWCRAHINLASLTFNLNLLQTGRKVKLYNWIHKS